MHVWVANDSLKAENKWTECFVRPACLVLGTLCISTPPRHDVKVEVLVVSAVPPSELVCFKFRLPLADLRGAV